MRLEQQPILPANNPTPEKLEETKNKDMELGQDAFGEGFSAEDYSEFMEGVPDDEKEAVIENMEEVKTEITNMNPKEKKTLFEGLANLGFRSTEWKSKGFSKLFRGLSKVSEKSKFLSTYFDKYAGIYDKTGKKARTQREKVGKGVISKGSGMGQGIGNAFKYGRVLYDFFGSGSIRRLNPFRHVTAAGMVLGRSFEAGKEVRLDSEIAKEKTRVNDLDRAEEEAHAIYEAAQKKSKTGEVTKEELTKAYQDNLPKDLQERLGRIDNLGTTFMARLLNKDMAFGVNRLVKKLEKLESDPNLSAEQKKAKREQIMKRQEDFMYDLDRMVGDQGTLDSIAYAVRTMEKTGKTAANVMMIDSAARLLKSAPRLASATLHSLKANEEFLNKIVGWTGVELAADPIENESEAPETPPNIPDSIPDPGEIEKQADLKIITDSLEDKDKENAEKIYETLSKAHLKGQEMGNFLKLKYLVNESVLPKDFSMDNLLQISKSENFGEDFGQLKAVLENNNIVGVGKNEDVVGKILENYAKSGDIENSIATIGKGEGMEHAARRLIEANPAKYGFTKTSEDFKGDEKKYWQALHEYSAREGHSLAIKGGFVKNLGEGKIEEVRIKEADKYAIKVEVDHPTEEAPASNSTPVAEGSASDSSETSVGATGSAEALEQDTAPGTPDVEVEKSGAVTVEISEITEKTDGKIEYEQIMTAENGVTPGGKELDEALNKEGISYDHTRDFVEEREIEQIKEYFGDKTPDPETLKKYAEILDLTDPNGTLDETQKAFLEWAKNNSERAGQVDRMKDVFGDFRRISEISQEAQNPLANEDGFSLIEERRDTAEKFASYQDPYYQTYLSGEYPIFDHDHQAARKLVGGLDVKKVEVKDKNVEVTVPKKFFKRDGGFFRNETLLIDESGEVYTKEAKWYTLGIFRRKKHFGAGVEGLHDAIRALKKGVPSENLEPQGAEALRSSGEAPESSAGEQLPPPTSENTFDPKKPQSRPPIKNLRDFRK